MPAVRRRFRRIARVAGWVYDTIASWRCRLVPRISCRRELYAVATVGILWMTGCSSPSSPSGNELSLDNRDNGRVLSVRPGEEIHVTLQTIGPGEYELPHVSSSAVVFLGVSILTPQNPGGPRQLFQFRVVAAGHADISFPHTGQNPRFAITVDVH
jgi:hypothetical protein